MSLQESGDRRTAWAWSDPRLRSLLFQAALILAVGLIGYEIAVNVSQNLATRNITSGWGFLSRSAGFDILFSLIPYASTSSFGRALLVGLLNTLLVSILGILLATVLGFLIGVMRLSGNWLASRTAIVYVEFLRNVPLLLVIFIWYKLVLKPLPDVRNAIDLLGVGALSNKGLSLPAPVFGPGASLALVGLAVALVGAAILHRWARLRHLRTGLSFPAGLASLALIILLPIAGLALAGWPLTFDYPVKGSFGFRGGATIVPEFMALLLALSTYTAAFIGEAVRAGIQAVSRGQTEAAAALGLRPRATMRLVIIPQALRVIIPPLTSQYLNLTKNSSLAIAIGYPDLVATGGTTLNQTGQAIEVVLVWMAVYLSLSLLTSAIMNWFNGRMRMVER